MGKRNQTDRKLLCISIVCFFLMSISFLLMSVKTMKVIPGVLFWGGLTGGIALQIVLAVRYRAFLKQHPEEKQKKREKRIGLLSFGASPAAMLADKVLAGSTVVMILTFIVTKGSGYLCFVFIATTLFSFCMHCVLNGRICSYVSNLSKNPVNTGNKKAKKTRKGEGRK